ncbi:hypothetical protein VTO42DRAFT_6516 [Malbranchea cinnamomea]
MVSLQSRWARFRHAFSSFHAFHEAIKLENGSSLSNEDLWPSPPERRTWRAFDFFAYWWSESWAVATWSVGSSMITLGATVRDAILIVLFANLVSAVVIVLNGRAAACYHIGYPVLSRTSFGINGTYFVVILRALLGIIWGGVQLYFEGQFIAVCLRCIFSGWDRIPNTIPEDQYITVQSFIGFVIAAVTAIPFMCVHTTKIRHFFNVKSIVIPLACMAVVIWATVANGGVSADKLVDESARTSTSVFAWGLIAQFNAVMGANCALLVTVPDLARYSKTHRSQVYGQALGLPLAQTVCASFGVITTAALKNMYGQAYWNPYDLLNGILDNENYSSGARAGVFFLALSWAFSALGTSLATNVAPFAADVTCLAPRYVNIIRGQFIWLIIAFAIVPWRIVATANGFLQFLNGYAIFQGSVVGIMLVDYFYVRRGNIHLPDLFTTSSLGRYYYTKGFNIRAFVSFVAGFLLPFPGFIASFGHSMAEAATQMFHLGWVLSLLVGSTAYFLGCLICKVPGDDRSFTFEEKVAAADEMILAGNLADFVPSSGASDKSEKENPTVAEAEDARQDRSVDGGIV